MGSVPSHQDCPECPECDAPCGTTEDAGGALLRCAACGHFWAPTDAEREQAERADRAYARMREQEEADATTYSLMPEYLREVNRRMLSRPRAEVRAEQLTLEVDRG